MFSFENAAQITGKWVSPLVGVIPFLGENGYLPFAIVRLPSCAVFLIFLSCLPVPYSTALPSHLPYFAFSSVVSSPYLRMRGSKTYIYIYIYISFFKYLLSWNRCLPKWVFRYIAVNESYMSRKWVVNAGLASLAHGKPRPSRCTVLLQKSFGSSCVT